MSCGAARSSRLVPGVDVARIDTSRNWVIGIRGFGDQFPKSVLVLIDGRSAYTPLWARVHWPIQDTLLEDVERMEVIRGPGGTIWGANAQNGVINIITKSSRETRGIYASAAAGKHGRGHRRCARGWRQWKPPLSRLRQGHETRPAVAPRLQRFGRRSQPVRCPPSRVGAGTGAAGRDPAQRLRPADVAPLTT